MREVPLYFLGIGINIIVFENRKGLLDLKLPSGERGVDLQPTHHASASEHGSSN